MTKDDKEKITLLSPDGVQEPDAIIQADNTDRRKAFSEAYKNAMRIVPDYFAKRKRKPNSR